MAKRQENMALTFLASIVEVARDTAKSALRIYFEPLQWMWRLIRRRAELYDDRGREALESDIQTQASDSNGFQPHRKARIYYLFERAAIAAAIILGLYGVLWFIGEQEAEKSPTYALAKVEELEDRLDKIVANYRSGLPSVNPVFPDSVFIRGITSLQSAHQRTLGCFPHYDDDRVSTAIADLKLVHASLKQLHEERIGNPNELEFERERALAAFLLAKAYLMQEKICEAQRWLSEIQLMHPDVLDYREDSIILQASLSSLAECPD